MVDAAVSFDRTSLAVAGTHGGTARRPAAGLAVSVAGLEAMSGYAAFCETALSAPPQDDGWVRHWTAENRPDAVFATLTVDGLPVLALALEIVRHGPFRVARFMGGRHANGNFAAMDPAARNRIDRAAIDALLAAIARARPDIDVVALERLLPDLDGVANPFACLPHLPSPNISLACDLEGGFDKLLDRASSKRKRKKHRSQIRKFEAAGSYRRFTARTPQETQRLLDAFFEMKASRFRKMGIADVFGEAEVRRFFQALFAGALREKSPRFILQALEVAGKIRAVTGSSVCGKRLICEFGAIAEDDLAHISPGEFLFFKNIEEACAQGFEIYDFSVGDEPYKRLWCDIEAWHLDVLAPLTGKGRLLAIGLRGQSRLKASIKQSPAVWRLARLLRRKVAGQPSSPSANDD